MERVQLGINFVSLEVRPRGFMEFASFWGVIGSKLQNDHDEDLHIRGDEWKSYSKQARVFARTILRGAEETTRALELMNSVKATSDSASPREKRIIEDALSARSAGMSRIGFDELYFALSYSSKLKDSIIDYGDEAITLLLNGQEDDAPQLKAFILFYEECKRLISLPRVPLEAVENLLNLGERYISLDPKPEESEEAREAIVTLGAQLYSVALIAEPLGIE